MDVEYKKLEQRGEHYIFKDSKSLKESSELNIGNDLLFIHDSLVTLLAIYTNMNQIPNIFTENEENLVSGLP